MARITDGKRTIELEMREYSYGNWSPDLSNDWLVTGLLEYDDENEVYILDCTMEDVIDGAMQWKYHSGDFEGCGEPSEDPDDFGVWIDGEWYEDESYREEEDEDEEEEENEDEINTHGLKMNDLIEESRKLKDLDSGMYYELFYDLDDGDVWTVFQSSLGYNSFTRYHSDSIIKVGDIDYEMSAQEAADAIYYAVLDHNAALASAQAWN